MNLLIKPILYFLVVFSGCSSSIINKVLYSTMSIGRRFTHPIFNNLVMFLAESTGIITFNLLFKDDEKITFSLPENLGKTPIETYKLSIPAILDLISSAFGCLSTDFLPGSLNDMLGGSSIVFTFLFSIFLMKNKHSKENYIGIGIIILGLVLLSLSEFLKNDSKDESSGHLLFGIVFNILANFFGSLHDIAQEYFIKKQICHPIKCIGFEGFYGLILSFIISLIFINIKCSEQKIRDKKIGNSISDILTTDVCIIDENGDSYFENFSFIWKQIKNNQNIFIYNIAIFFVLIMLNYSYTGFLQVSNAISRIVLSNITSLIVWVFFLLPIHKGKRYQETFKVLQLIGFLVLAFGVFYYNELICKDKSNGEINETDNTENLIPKSQIDMQSIKS